MTYSVTCREAGFDCSAVLKGNTEEEVMQKAGRHTQQAHGVQQSAMTPEMTEKIRSLIKEETR